MVKKTVDVKDYRDGFKEMVGKLSKLLSNVNPSDIFKIDTELNNQATTVFDEHTVRHICMFYQMSDADDVDIADCILALNSPILSDLYQIVLDNDLSAYESFRHNLKTDVLYTGAFRVLLERFVQHEGLWPLNAAAYVMIRSHPEDTKIIIKITEFITKIDDDVEVCADGTGSEQITSLIEKIVEG